MQASFLHSFFEHTTVLFAEAVTRTYEYKIPYIAHYFLFPVGRNVIHQRCYVPCQNKPHGDIRIPEGGYVCLWALQSLLPVITPMERESAEERDEDWLWQTWGVTVSDPPYLTQNERYFKVTAVRIDEGPCAIINTVFDWDPKPLQGIRLAWWYADGPSPPEDKHHLEEPVNIYDHDWKKDHFELGLTDPNGAWRRGGRGRGGKEAP